MGNMPYCRFQNTLQDLRKCLSALIEGEGISPEEQKAKEQLVKVCKSFIQEHEKGDGQ